MTKDMRNFYNLRYLMEICHYVRLRDATME